MQQETPETIDVEAHAVKKYAPIVTTTTGTQVADSSDMRLIWITDASDKTGGEGGGVTLPL